MIEREIVREQRKKSYAKQTRERKKYIIYSKIYYISLYIYRYRNRKREMKRKKKKKKNNNKKKIIWKS